MSNTDALPDLLYDRSFAFPSHIFCTQLICPCQLYKCDIESASQIISYKCKGMQCLPAHFANIAEEGGSCSGPGVLSLTADRRTLLDQHQPGSEHTALLPNLITGSKSLPLKAAACFQDASSYSEGSETISFFVIQSIVTIMSQHSTGTLIVLPAVQVSVVHSKLTGKSFEIYSRCEG